MPAVLKYCTTEVKNAQQYSEFKKVAERFDMQEKSFRSNELLYNRNVTIIAVIAAIILVIASLTLFKEILLIADGILLGGVFTLIYSIIRGFSAEDSRFQFVVVTIGLIISLVLGYIKFIRPASKEKKLK